MVIVLVIDTFDGSAKGAPLAAQNMQRALSQAGHEVRIVSCDYADSMYRVKRRWIPYLSFMAKFQGIAYAKPDEAVLRGAFDGADLVHLVLPFALEKKAAAVARSLQIPVIASFAGNGYTYVQLAGLGLCPGLSGIACRLLQFNFYFKFEHILIHSRKEYTKLPGRSYVQKLDLIEDSDFENITEAAVRLENIYKRAIADDKVKYTANSHPNFRKNWAVMPSSIDITNPFRKQRLFFRIWYTWCYYSTVALAAVCSYIGFGLRARGRQNLAGLKGGAITVSNHIHNVDGAFIAVSLAPVRIVFTSIEGNFRLPLVRWINKWVGGVPIPAATHALRGFFDHTVNHLKDGKKVHFYPEGSLSQYCTGLRPFKKGAFHMAVNAGVPVIPVVLVQRPCTGLRRIFRRRPLFSAVICPPVYPDPALSGTRQVDDMRDRTYRVMSKALEKDQYDPQGDAVSEASNFEVLNSGAEETTPLTGQST